MIGMSGAKPRVIFFGSRDSRFSDELFYSLAGTECDIAAVVHSPEGRMGSTSGNKAGSGYPGLAESMGLPCFEPDNPNSPEFTEMLRSIPCDLFIAAGYVMLMKKELLSLPEKGIAINFHASLLPDYKGKHPVFWAIRCGETRSGITAHHMSEKIDEGHIAFQEAVDIGPGDSVSDVYGKVIEKSRAVMTELMKAVNAGSIPAIPQKGAGSYYSSIREEDYILDFSLPANRNKWAVQATPGKCYFNTPHGRIYAFDALAMPGVDGGEDGVIIDMDDGGLTVSSGGAAVRFGRLSMDGKPAGAGGLARSLGYNVGDKL